MYIHIYIYIYIYVDGVLSTRAPGGGPTALRGWRQPGQGESGKHISCAPQYFRNNPQPSRNNYSAIHPQSFNTSALLLQYFRNTSGILRQYFRNTLQYFRNTSAILPNTPQYSPTLRKTPANFREIPATLPEYSRNIRNTSAILRNTSAILRQCFRYSCSGARATREMHETQRLVKRRLFMLS